MDLKYLLPFVLMSGVMSLSLEQIDEEWNLFRLKFNRAFTSAEEENYRYSVFVENLKTIFLHNMAADKGHYSYWLGINNFTDLTDIEFEAQYTRLKAKPRAKTFATSEAELYSYNLTASLPKEVDWRKKNCVTPVKTQGKYGSCYAFAATGALEGHICIKTGKLVSLSEQNVLDCTNNGLFSNEGCVGGQAVYAFRYVINNSGIDTEKSYPYLGEVGKCKFTVENIGATAKTYKVVPDGNEYALKNAVGGAGPVAVCLDTKGTKQYEHGVYDGINKENNTKCSSLQVNHAMLIVGYGTTETGIDYWLIKNSWGSTWGIDGYMKFVRNAENRCGIASYASFPIV